MRWEDERYVRVYTRDTGDWLALSWDAQGLMMQILRKVDRAGILSLGRKGRESLPILLGHKAEHERILSALRELESDGCVLVDNDRLVIPNFIEAQEAGTSDAARKRFQRERDRDKAIARGVQKASTIVYFIRRGSDGPIKIGFTSNLPSRLEAIQAMFPEPAHVLASMPGEERDEAALHRKFSAHRLSGEWFAPSEELLGFISSLVTASHNGSQGVTVGHSVPCLAVPPVLGRASTSFQKNENNPPEAGAAAEPPQLTPEPLSPKSKKRKPARPKADSDPRHVEFVTALCAVFETERGEKYPFDGGRDAKAVTKVIKFSGGDLTVARARWKSGLSAPGYVRCNWIHELASKWPAIGDAKRGFDPRKSPVRAEEITNYGPEGEIAI